METETFEIKIQFNSLGDKEREEEWIRDMIKNFLIYGTSNVYNAKIVEND